MARFTQAEIDEKTADVVIEMIEILEDYYPDTFREIVESIIEGTYE